MKKGFTLVELLAVIAILAILVIIALPNVMGMFNIAKENSFKTEVKEIFKTAQQTWMTDSRYSSGEQVYSRCKSGCSNGLDLSGRTDLEYYIKLNASGKVVEYYATDGTFQYSFSDPDGLKLEDIKSTQKISDITNQSEVIKITSSGVSGGSNSSSGNNQTTTPRYAYLTKMTGTIGVGDTLPSTLEYFGTYLEAKSNHYNNGFVRLELDDNDVIIIANLGFFLNNNEYYLTLGTSDEIFEANKAVALQGFVTDYTGFQQSTCSGTSTYTCWNGGAGMHVYLHSGNSITIENERDQLTFSSSNGKISYSYRPD